MLRQHKPPPIRRIQISDFGLPDPKRDPDRHQNCITWSLSLALSLQKISSKSVHKFASNPTDRQTDKQTDRQTDHTENITSFFGGGKNANCLQEFVHNRCSNAQHLHGHMPGDNFFTGQFNVNNVLSEIRPYHN